MNINSHTIHVQGPGQPIDYTSIIIFIVLVCLSAFFSATETAFTSLNKTRLKALAESGSKRAASTLDLANRFDNLLSSILVGNNIVNISAASLATLFFVKINEDYGPTIATAVVTLTILIFGEITPKVIAKDYPETFAQFATPVMRLLVLIFTPVNYAFSLWNKFIAKFMRTNNSSKMSQAELLMLVEEVEHDGAIDDDDGEMLRNVIEFTDQEASDILTPRVDLVAMPSTATMQEIACKFSESKFSRLLIYNDSIDSIVGVIHLKDIYTTEGITTKTVQEVMTPPIYTHESIKIKDLLKQLQASKSHIAVITDEYGGTCGIVTMEDILEQLVGDIWDEHDKVVQDLQKIGDRAYSVDGSMLLTDFQKFLDFKEESEATTVSGWVMEKLERIPALNDEFHFDHFTIKVTEIAKHRVKTISVTVDEDTPLPEGDKESTAEAASDAESPAEDAAAEKN